MNKIIAHLTLPELRAAIRGLTDTAGHTPLQALLRYQANGEESVWEGLTENENAALRALLLAYNAGCLDEAIEPQDGWLPARNAA